MDKIEKEMYEMIQILNKWTKAYDEGHPVVSDKEWDELYFELKKLEDESGIALPGSPTGKISYEVKSELKKVKHNHKMLSLDKTKDWNEFINYFVGLDSSKDVCGMVKLDGLTCSLRYAGGKLISAETRGNGEIGEDILHNILTMASVPQYIDYDSELVIDGEVICTISDFEGFKDEYKNPRNFASGSIRLLDANECKKRHLTFVVWNVVKGFYDENSFMARLEMAKKLGFLVVPYTSSFDWDAKDYLIETAKKLGYPSDGLVGRFDDVEYGTSLGETGHHARAAYAFKFYDEEYETILQDIEWSMGRTSILTPIAIFDPIDIDGTTVSRASMHNVSVLMQTLTTPHRGQKVYVAKMNMIIPQIVRAEVEPIEKITGVFQVPIKCPVCGGETKLIVSASGAMNLFCMNPDCDGKLINRIEHFAGKKGLDIKGISKATFGKLIDWGWINCAEDIFNLKEHREEWIKKDGFGIKSVDKMLESIEAARHCNLENYIAALGIPLIGRRYAKIIAEKEETWENFINDINSMNKFYLWDGFGPEMHDALINFDYVLAKEMVNKGIIIFNEIEPKEEYIQSLSGVKIVITGKLSTFKNRNELKELIESCGGQVVGSVSKNTNILINNDVNSSSSKNVSAKKLGIPIMSEKDFKEKYFDFF